MRNRKDDQYSATTAKYHQAQETNTQVAEIEAMILQASTNYRTQIAGDIFSISKDL